MATIPWTIPVGKAITGSTYIKDTDNNLSDTIDDLVAWTNNVAPHAGTGLSADFVDKASIQTISGAKTFSAVLVASGGVTGNVTGDLTGKLTNTRAITLEGDTTGTVNFDGSADVVITSSFRAGMIMMWSGSVASIPSGWHLCDGLNGTPDLRGRSIMGAIDDGIADFSVGKSGDGTIPSHDHNADHNHTAGSSTGGAHTHTYRKWGESAPTNSFSGGSTVTAQNVSTQATSSDGDHSHTITVDTKTMNTGTSGTGTEVIPKYYALAYIMKG